MNSETTNNNEAKKEIAAMIKDHLTRHVFGMEVEGEFRTELFGGTRIVIVVRHMRDSKNDKIRGDISVIHSEYGQWISYWKGNLRATAPRLRHDAVQIRTFIEQKSTWNEAVLWVFGAESNTSEA